MSFLARLVIVIGGILPVVLFAQTNDTFLIRTFVGTDITPPTQPAFTSVTPVSPNQIDLTWGAVTDDVSVEGYRVYRDGVLLATTTLLSYIDTGLTPSTTYTYTLDAFDFFLNVSSTSVPVATTTLALPSPVATTSTSTRQSPTSATATAVPTLRHFLLEPNQTSARINFSSYGPTRFTLRYGRTEAYEMGTVSSNIFATDHLSPLYNLEPGTRYFIELRFTNALGIERVVKRDLFSTNAAVVSDIPPGVRDLSAVTENDSVRLNWENPPIPLSTIIVVRNHLFYPTDPLDGVVVYDGQGESYIDSAVFAKQPSYYYGVFVRMPDGRVSAPAVVYVSVRTEATDQVGSTATPTSTGTSRTLPIIGQPITDEGNEEFLSPDDVFVTFDNTTQTMASPLIIPTDTTVLVSIPFSAVPNRLKAIVVTVLNPTNHRDASVYLLKLRGDGTAYEASFISSSVAGEGRLTIELFDYERESLRRITRSVQYIDTADNIVFVRDFLRPDWQWVWWIGGGLGVLFFIIVWWRRREDNQ